MVTSGLTSILPSPTMTGILDKVSEVNGVGSAAPTGGGRDMWIELLKEAGIGSALGFLLYTALSPSLPPQSLPHKLLFG